MIVAKLVVLYFSYRQTAEAYPNGGGAYNVTKDNFGVQAALWAAVALLLDYVLNVAVGISAGIGAVVSAIPALQAHTLGLCVAVLLTLGQSAGCSRIRSGFCVADVGVRGLFEHYDGNWNASGSMERWAPPFGDRAAADPACNSIGGRMASADGIRERMHGDDRNRSGQ